MRIISAGGFTGAGVAPFNISEGAAGSTSSPRGKEYTVRSILALISESAPVSKFPNWEGSWGPGAGRTVVAIGFGMHGR